VQSHSAFVLMPYETPLYPQADAVPGCAVGFEATVVRKLLRGRAGASAQACALACCEDGACAGYQFGFLTIVASKPTAGSCPAAQSP